MSTTAPRRLNSKLECQKCQTIYLTLAQDVTVSTAIYCSSCGGYMGTWGELESEFIAEGGECGVFEMRDGQIIRID
ncbi:hypothetical protein BLM14_14760 [Phyllobacterium zundukense]|nr:hypothetical protein BLM14_14760 [Phyllobacterium zundukense]